jgi:hypothetical protein
MSATSPVAAVIALPSAATNRPGGSLDRPFNHADALADLASLGRTLNRQAADGASMAVLDATLTVMRAVHTRIVAELGSALAASSYRVARRRRPRAA